MSTVTLSRRDRALLVAIGEGRCEVVPFGVPDLRVDGRWFCDQPRAHALVGAGLLAWRRRSAARAGGGGGSGAPAPTGPFLLHLDSGVELDTDPLAELTAVGGRVDIGDLFYDDRRAPAWPL